MKILVGGSLIIDGEQKNNLAVVFDDRIIDIIPEADIVDYDGDIIRYTGTLMPGFIDIHIHGAGGADTMDASFEALATIADTIVRSGTTSFLATTMTMAQSQIEASLDQVRAFLQNQTSGARCLGAHLEGPFINPAMKGAQNAQFIQPPTSTWLEPYMDIIKLITLAPEMDPDYAFIRELKDRVVLSIGHSKADYQTALESFQAGIKHVTHCFNAMTGLHHREPGIVGAAMTQAVSVDMITDLVHVHPDLFQLFIDIKGRDKFIAITDAMRAAFLDEGEYDLGGQAVTVKGNKCLLSDGTIAGSVHRMDKALQNLLKYTDMSLAEVSQVLSASPAKLLGIDHKKGHLRVGYDADFVIMDQSLAVTDVYIQGGKE
ncbi:MAG TPA: N-acetylglucosamine-6-phosphate deacetylase [Tissierellia bacterium]|nr:N-acetylglucosamine-6-phosphate deacetylase [Tissierellia bacterium]